MQELYECKTAWRILHQIFTWFTPDACIGVLFGWETTWRTLHQICILCPKVQILFTSETSSFKLPCNKYRPHSKMLTCGYVSLPITCYSLLKTLLSLQFWAWGLVNELVRGNGELLRAGGREAWENLWCYTGVAQLSQVNPKPTPGITWIKPIRNFPTSDICI